MIIFAHEFASKLLKKIYFFDCLINKGYEKIIHGAGFCWRFCCLNGSE